MSSKPRKTPTMESLGLQESGLYFPTSANRVINFPPDVIRQDALDTRIVVHGRFPELVERFLAHKRIHGSSIEKQLYGPGWTWPHQVTRLIEKRPLSFVGPNDSTLLRTGQSFQMGTRFWDSIGAEGTPYKSLEEYLTYDEIMLGSLMGVSSPSYFINDGARDNNGRPQDAGTFEPRGIIIGLVGPRFERLLHMDSNLILDGVVARQQHPELTNIFLDFLGVGERSELEIEKFSIRAYTERIRISADILLLEANERAKAVGRKAYVYIVGLGLGVWLYDALQPEFFINAFKESLMILGPKLTHIRTLEFAWIRVAREIQEQIAGITMGLGITTIFSRRNPTEKLRDQRADQLLVISYPWDGNSFPGNEYWEGNLSGSGDPAAACMSTIAELHNPLVNPGFTQRIFVVDSSEK
ncbi:hypothetical protein F4813DRAFT_347974 [Daldinia decipiens]|uniref:uncharacterized protein n=1 Tax=Daldinia decipiens TaxID=326647 RepID=UPI0020C3F980|nr:uncharacterized protein F4813DRAFT_347974 [Daldinia decipiens]KAI1660661.1 hypothetical protein F4813DRAFT_347974 [Daldinia decipiens]